MADYDVIEIDLDDAGAYSDIEVEWYDENRNLFWYAREHKGASKTIAKRIAKVTSLKERLDAIKFAIALKHNVIPHELNRVVLDWGYDAYRRTVITKAMLYVFKN